MRKRIKYLLICLLCIGNFMSTIMLYNIVQAERYDLSWNIKFVYKVLPVLVVMDPESRLLDKNVAGAQVGPIIIIGDNYGDEDNVIRHELEHVRQAYRGLFVWNMYKKFTDKKRRVLNEYAAYKAETNPYRDDVIVEILLSDTYSLDMTRKEIYEVINNRNN